MIKTKYDVIMVGAGIANIMGALRLIKTDPTISILMLEKGPSIRNRGCPKNKVGKCVHCKPICNISGGFSGAGCFSDGKLTFSKEIGGNLIDYIDVDTFDTLEGWVNDIFTEFGGSNDELVFDKDFADSFSNDCQRYGMKLLKTKVRHLGSDGLFEIMNKVYDYFESLSNIDVVCNAEVSKIDFENKRVVLKKEIPIDEVETDSADTFYADYISIAVGRSGSNWLREVCEINGVPLENGQLDIGVRVELPAIIMKDVCDKLYEAKIVNYSETENKVRTFCMNPGGIVVQENYDDKIVGVNGHSLLNTKTDATNFALLVTCRFTQPFNKPIEYGRRICELTNFLADGKVMVQRLHDLKAKKRSTKERMARLSFTPTLKDAEPGDLRYVLPANVIDSLIDTIDNLNNVIPGINGKDTIFYGTEAKFYSSKVKLTDTLESPYYPNIFFAGDSSGVTRGIMQAGIAGAYIADQILTYMEEKKS